MSPEAGEVLLGEVVPRLRSAIPRCVRGVGAEDAEELVADAIAVAAGMLDRVEKAGKRVTPGNIAYYTILHMKSGRRSYGYSRADAMATGTQLDGKSSLLSMEEEVGYDPELDEAIRLEELLACPQEDPAQAASRNLDWEMFLASHDHRYGPVVQGVAEGRPLKELGTDGRSGFSRVYAMRQKLSQELREFLGEEAIADAAQMPKWRGNIVARQERAACMAARRG